MIGLVLLVVIIVLLAITPWRRLSSTGRFWALAACLNTLVSFSMPTTLATSPWRPVVQLVLTVSAVVSFLLFGVGLILLKRQGWAAEISSVWIGLLVLGLLPGVLYTIFWLIGPLY